MGVDRHNLRVGVVDDVIPENFVQITKFVKRGHHYGAPRDLCVGGESG